MKKIITFFFVWVIIFTIGCSSKKKSVDTVKSEELKKLYITQVPSISPRELIKNLLPLKKLLSNWLNMDIIFVFEKDYGTILDKVKDYPYDIIFFGPKSYIKAHRLAGYNAFLKPIRNKKSVYYGIIIVRKDNEVSSLEDLEGQSFGFVDKNSSSGFEYPYLLFKKHHINPYNFFSDVKFLGSHDKVVRAVFNQNVDAGAVYDGAIEDTYKREPNKIKKLRVISRTASIPNEPIAYSPKLDPVLVKKIQEAFLNLNKTVQGKIILENLHANIDGYTTASDTDYDIVREVMDELGR